MSQNNGDKARFHRQRKAKAIRRLRVRELVAALKGTVPKARPADGPAAAVRRGS